MERNASIKVSSGFTGRPTLSTGCINGDPWAASGSHLSLGCLSARNEVVCVVSWPCRCQRLRSSDVFVSEFSVVSSFPGDPFRTRL